MAHITKDRVKETTTTTGTGPFALVGSPVGFRQMSAVCAVGDTFRGTLQGVDASGSPSGEWQSGTFVYSAANEITTVVVEDSSTGSAVSFSAGTKEVWIGQTATQAKWSREKLTANRTYYVRTDGADTNSGLANTTGGAFLTIQKAVDVVCDALDVSIYTVTIQVADGTYTGAATLKSYVGATTPIVQGNITTPANCIISTTSANAVTNSSGRAWSVKGFKLQTTTSGNCLNNSGFGTSTSFSDLNFGACAGSHIVAGSGNGITASGNYAISGGAQIHWSATDGGTIITASRTVTITGTPAFSTCFAYGRNCGTFLVNGMTFSGSATGQRYNLSTNSALFTNNAGVNYLPGDAAGTAATGGQYF